MIHPALFTSCVTQADVQRVQNNVWNALLEYTDVHHMQPDSIEPTHQELGEQMVIHLNDLKSQLAHWHVKLLFLILSDTAIRTWDQLRPSSRLTHSQYRRSLTINPLTARGAVQLLKREKRTEEWGHYSTLSLDLSVPSTFRSQAGSVHEDTTAVAEGELVPQTPHSAAPVKKQGLILLCSALSSDSIPISG